MPDTCSCQLVFKQLRANEWNSRWFGAWGSFHVLLPSPLSKHWNIDPVESTSANIVVNSCLNCQARKLGNCWRRPPGAPRQKNQATSNVYKSKYLRHMDGAGSCLNCIFLRHYVLCCSFLSILCARYMSVEVVACATVWCCLLWCKVVHMAYLLDDVAPGVEGRADVGAIGVEAGCQRVLLGLNFGAQLPQWHLWKDQLGSCSHADLLNSRTDSWLWHGADAASHATKGRIDSVALALNDRQIRLRSFDLDNNNLHEHLIFICIFFMEMRSFRHRWATWGSHTYILDYIGTEHLHEIY